MNFNATQDQQPITITQVADEEVFNFLPALFPNCYLHGEQSVYSTMRQFCSDYQGGQWLYYDLSNGGRLMALESDDMFVVRISSNHFDDELTSQATSIVVNLYVLTRFAEALYDRNREVSEHLYGQHRLLMDFAREHPESEKILRAIN